MSKEIEQEIKTLKDNLNNSEIPQGTRDDWAKLIKNLEAKLDKKPKASQPLEKKPKQKRSKNPISAWANKAQAEATKEFKAKEAKSSKVDYDCDELIEKEKAKAKKAKASAAKRAKKPESKKNVERVEKATEVVEKSIKERKSTGKQVTAEEIKKLIKEHEEAIKMLKKQLESLENHGSSGKPTMKTDSKGNTTIEYKELKGSKPSSSPVPYIVAQTISGDGYSDPEIRLVANEKEAIKLKSKWVETATIDNGVKAGDWEHDKNSAGLETEDEDYIQIQKISAQGTPKGKYVIVKYTEPNEIDIHSVSHTAESVKKTMQQLAATKNHWEDADEVESYLTDTMVAGHGPDGFEHYEAFKV